MTTARDWIVRNAGWFAFAALVTWLAEREIRSRIPAVDVDAIQAIEPRELIVVSGDLVGVTGDRRPVLRMYRTADTVVLYTRCAP